MIRSDTDWAPAQTAWPDSGAGRPDPAAGWSAADAGWPAAGRASSPVLDAEQETEPEIRRPEAYRRLWLPPTRRPARDQALGRPSVWEIDQPLSRTGRRPADLSAGSASGAGRRGGRDAPRMLTGPVPLTERAVIGDLLREPAAWCGIGACVARHTDPAALGEADIRRRAMATGWCIDAFGRLVCPSCQQRYPIWTAQPLARRERTGRRMARATARHVPTTY